VKAVCINDDLAVGEHIALTAEDRLKVEKAYGNIALSNAAFEGSTNKFSSRFDRGKMWGEELDGENLFGGKGKCQQCHTNKGSQPLFHGLRVPHPGREPGQSRSQLQHDRVRSRPRRLHRSGASYGQVPHSHHAVVMTDQ
jgi:hypothetical protein